MGKKKAKSGSVEDMIAKAFGDDILTSGHDVLNKVNIVDFTPLLFISIPPQLFQKPHFVTVKKRNELIVLLSVNFHTRFN
ncbi:unnamed protein product [marine sediment metagenome]|uniref:Uncharacterized protein n=1 Tax=marine sediment metagenome TaxID=412755 RepID=X1PSV1_9ZZZZ